LLWSKRDARVVEHKSDMVVVVFNHIKLEAKYSRKQAFVPFYKCSAAAAELIGSDLGLAWPDLSLLALLLCPDGTHHR
jgi:hypothetical protein